MSKDNTKIKSGFTRSFQKLQRTLKKNSIPEQIKLIVELLGILGDFLERTASDSLKVSDKITALEKRISEIEKRL